MMVNKKIIPLLSLLILLSFSINGISPTPVHAGGGIIGSDTNILILPIIIFAILAVLFVALGKRRR